ncbi:MAG TPA: DUF6691 family protein [Nevskiaceae bacterium]|nr:DUF6691 family protein [Nevskiaceae bacterium]
MKFSALLAGLLFGVGLVLSGMTDPHRVIGFLDFFGAWDPSLAFVMGGAVLTALPAFAYARRHERTPTGVAFPRIDRMRIDARLLGGAAIFGAGWGLAGLCPGPGLVQAGAGSAGGWIFIAGIALGAWLASRYDAARAKNATTAP